MADPIHTEFTEEERITLGNYVTNASGNVFAWKLGEQLDSEAAGALLSRYSRSSMTSREIFLKEFLPNRDRGREFFRTWLIGYGDDSIQEMAGGIPVSAEYISNVAAKELEDSRIASYIEKSTRYVDFSRKIDGYGYQFYRPHEIMASKLSNEYVALMNDLFESYSTHSHVMAKHIRDTNPFEGCAFQIGNEIVKGKEVNDKFSMQGISAEDLHKAYDKAALAASLDIIRDYLPLSTLTHVGISANARSYENIVLKLLSSGLAESRGLAQGMNEELKKIAPSLIRRTEEEHGKEQVEHMKRCAFESRNTVSAVLDSHKKLTMPHLTEMHESVSFIDFAGRGTKNPNEHAMNVVAGTIIYKNSELSLEESIKAARSMSSMEKDAIIGAYVSERKNRRQKPGRAFENLEYTFDMKGTIGSYRDLQRHRIATQERKYFSTEHGYVLRKQYIEAGIADDYKSKMDRVAEMHHKLSKELSPQHAQYTVAFGYNARWYMKMNAREFFHLAELRTMPAGHPDYREMVQEMYNMVRKEHPSIAKHMKFVNMEHTELGRLSSEIRTAMKTNKVK